MAKIPGLIQRYKAYYLRVRIPTDLVEIYGKKEITKSLETRDYSVARKRINIERVGIEADFEKRRQQIKAMNENTDMLSGYTDHDLTSLTLKWVHEVKVKEQARRILDTETWTDEQEHAHALELQQEEWVARKEKIGASKQDKHEGMTIASQFLKQEGISYSGNSDNFRKLGHFFSKAVHELAQQRLREWQGTLHIPNDPAFAASPLVTGYTAPGKAITMGDLVKEYLSDQKVKRGETTLKNYRLISRAIDEVIGNQTFAHQVTREHCRQISNLLFSFPANATKTIKAKTLAETVKIGQQEKKPTLAASTYNTYMQKLNAIMDYAVRELYISANPAKKLYVENIVKKKNQRNPFTLEQLKKIFHHKIYQELRLPALLYSPKSKKKPTHSRYWIPLISLWSGMRLNEICQLYLSDITVLDKVHVILIRDTDGEHDEIETEKRVKTENGIRFVPIHPALIEAGFLDYVESVRKANETRLFPNLTLDARGYYSHEYTKWFSRHLKSIGAKTAKTSFHSFRHTYRDAVRKAQLPRDAHLQLGGWSSGATDDDYGSGLDAKDLYEELCKIKYDSLDLAHLYK